MADDALLVYTTQATYSFACTFGASPIIIFIDEDQKWPAKLFVAGVAPRLDVLLVSPKLTCALFTTTLNFN